MSSTKNKISPADKKKQFSRRIIEWFNNSGRTFFWREKNEPWHLLISELFLKKTRAERVEIFVKEFLKKYPEPSSLNLIDLNELENDLAPLGLQKQRAAHIKALCENLVIKYEGSIPQKKKDLIKLPGIGDYTKNALLCFAFGEKVPIIDANVIRILLRVFKINYSRAEARRSPEIWELAWDLLPWRIKETKAYNYGLLDLGALICVPRNPKCEICPLKDFCYTASTK